ncbi:FAD/NAD(P)-binding domain-containing protein [Thozetella sp. PMI_491]|nr:FAD/NAD(P)-binding domain-containing protein [Thozetella sp. PMI_491]
MSAKLPRLAPSGIKVIIAGAGFAGLTAAIECHRKGHDVILFEKSAELAPLGDIISFGQNSTRIFASWPGVMEQCDPIMHKADAVTFFDWQGRYVTTQSFVEEKKWGQRINAHRGELHDIVFRHAKERGIDIRLGHNVVDYFETDNEGGVELEDGTRHTADIVFAAEGVRSRGRKTVLGYEDKPQSSGYAVFRAWFPADELAKNDLTKDLVGKDTHNGWIGEDVHFLVAAVKDGTEVSWVCTHKDAYDIEESWQFPGRIEDALAVVEGWAPVAREIIKLTPPHRLFDYKLVYRDPLPTFISPKARIALIGDAAHPFLPTSIQGASQAMEDGVAAAACLDLAAKEGIPVPEAIRAWEKIRYERVHKVQATGVATRNQWHHADWDAIWKDPESLHLKREAWVLNFDSEADTYASFEKARASLSSNETNGAA